MKVTLRARDRTEPARTGAPARRWFVVAAATAVAWSLLSAPVARADETVRFDGGGAEISLIGDSTLAGVRWYADYGELRRFDMVLNAESCRRTIEQSCISREGFRSATVVQTIESLAGELGEVLVVMTGYNDPVWSIDEAIDGVVEGARDAGVEHVVWLSLRTSDDVDYSDPQEQSSVETFREYNEQLVAAAEASDGFLQVADWATYSTGAGDWFEYDGVHLTARGVDALTGFIATTVDRVLSGEDVSPTAAPWVVLVPGAEGPDVEAVQQALLDAGVEVPGGVDGIYGNDTMAAVAAFQRDAGTLQVTGAVDAATARALGLHDDDPAAADPSIPPTTAPADPDPAPATAAVEPSTEQLATRTPSAGGRGTTTAIVAILVIVAASVIAVVARGRYVARRRHQRRWVAVDATSRPRSPQSADA